MTIAVPLPGLDLTTFDVDFEDSIDLKFEFFCKMHHRIPFFIALRLSARWFSMSLEGLSFAKTVTTFGVINATNSVTQRY